MAYLTKKTYGEKLLDPRWQMKRLEIFKRDNATCQRCGDTENTLHVHHFCYKKGVEPWDAPDDTLITFCADCHKINHLDRKLFSQLELELIEYVRILTRFDGEKSEFETDVLKDMNQTILKLKS